MRFVLALLVIAACGKNTEPPPPSSGSPNAQPESGPSHRRSTTTASADGINEKAKQMFATVCATCHGSNGQGDGPAAKALDPKPRNYTDAAWQASITDDQIKTTILKGGAGVGKSPMMPGNPQLEQEPEVLDGLVKIIRGFKQ